MLFDYIRFRNYRVFYGEQTVWLNGTDETHVPYKRNITLIGGLNGAGKTSVINAFFICLYGRRFFSRDDYEEIRINAINNRFLRENGRSSSIELCFTDNYQQYIIMVEWVWNDRTNTIEESRRIYESSNYQAHRVIASTPEDFDQFVDQRIPIDVAPFFIFDAERIGQILGSQKSQDMVASIQKVVSLELYKQLRSDLEHQKKQAEKDVHKLVKDEELARLHALIRECDANHKAAQQKLSEVEAQLKSLRQKRAEVEQRRRDKLVQNSLTKKQINRQLREIESKLAVLDESLAKSRKNLPFFLLSPLIKELKERIDQEQSYQRVLERNRVTFASYNEFMEELLRIPLNPPLTDEQATILRTKGKAIWAQCNRLTQESPPKDFEIWHDLGKKDLDALRNWHSPSIGDIEYGLSERRKLLSFKENLEAKLNEAPDEIDIDDENREIEKLDQKIGQLETARRHFSKKVAESYDAGRKYRDQAGKKRRLMEEIGPIQEKIELLQRLTAATSEFVDQVTVMKAHQLKQEIESILRRLLSKDDIARVDFDPKSYQIRLYSIHDEPIDINSRSEGEKQLISLAMIWALTKVSGASFPFVIDTPLARLDSIHRSHLVSFYFPNLSDQIIILSTDTEITKDFVDEISPYTRRKYLLSYDNVNEYSTIQDGYFEFNE